MSCERACGILLKKKETIERANDVIKEYIVAHLENGMRVEDASKNLNVVERQMEIWLKRLCEDKLIRLDKGVYRKA